ARLQSSPIWRAMADRPFSPVCSQAATPGGRSSLMGAALGPDAAELLGGAAFITGLTERDASGGAVGRVPGEARGRVPPAQDRGLVRQRACLHADAPSPAGWRAPPPGFCPRQAEKLRPA